MTTTTTAMELMMMMMSSSWTAAATTTIAKNFHNVPHKTGYSFHSVAVYYISLAQQKVFSVSPSSSFQHFFFICSKRFAISHWWRLCCEHNSAKSSQTTLQEWRWSVRGLSLGIGISSARPLKCMEESKRIMLDVWRLFSGWRSEESKGERRRQQHWL